MTRPTTLALLALGAALHACDLHETTSPPPPAQAAGAAGAAGADAGPPEGLCGPIHATPEELTLTGTIAAIAVDNDFFYWADEGGISSINKETREAKVIVEVKNYQSISAFQILNEGVIFIDQGQLLQQDGLKPGLQMKLLPEWSTVEFFYTKTALDLFWVGVGGIHNYENVAVKKHDEPKETSLIELPGTVEHMLVTGKYVYFSYRDYKKSSLVRVAQGDGSVETIFDGDVLATATDGERIYWTTDQGQLWGVARSGGAPGQLAKNLGRATSLVAAGGCLYTANEQGISRVPRGGGEPAQVVTFGAVSSFNAPPIAVDSGHLYWPDHQQPRLMRLPVNP